MGGGVVADVMTEEFLERYKRLEEAARTVFTVDDGHDSAIGRLMDTRKYREFRTDLDYCREVRNLLQHRPKIAGGFAVNVSNEMLDFLDDLTSRLLERQRALAVATKPDRLLSCRYSDRLSVIVARMLEHGFSYVPVMEGKQVVGVLDHDSVFHCLADHGRIDLDEGGTIGEMEEYLSLDNRRSEMFTFRPRTVYLDELEEEFEARFREGKRIAITFITESGKRTESVLGMLTAWDILAIPD